MRYLLALPGLLLSFLSSCYKTDDFSDMEKSVWSPHFAIPLATANLNAGSIFTAADSVSGGSGPVTLIYSSLAYSDYAGNILSVLPFDLTHNAHLSAQSVQTINQSPALTRSEDSAQIQTVMQVVLPGAPNAAIDSLEFGAGIIKLALQSEIPQRIYLHYECPELIKGNTTLKGTLTIEPEGRAELNLLASGFTFKPANDNILRVNCLIETEKRGPDTVTENQDLRISFSLIQPRFRWVAGKFPQLQMPFISEDTLFPGIFRNVVSPGDLQLSNPQIGFTWINHTGMRLEGSINSVRGYRRAVQLPGFPLNTASQTTEIAPFSENTIHLDEAGNPGLNAFFNAAPQRIISGGSHNLIPLTNPQGIVRDTSRIIRKNYVTIPLHGSNINVLIQDTLGFDYTKITRNFEELIIRTVSNNSFPMDVKLQIYFGRKILLGNGKHSVQKLDSLYTGSLPVIGSAPVDAEGKSRGSTELVKDAGISGVRWTRLYQRKADCILVKAVFTSANSSEVFVTDTDRIQLKLAAQIKGKSS